MSTQRAADPEMADMRRQVSVLRRELGVLRLDNHQLRSENQRLRDLLDDYVSGQGARRSGAGSAELTAGTCVGPRRAAVARSGRDARGA